MVSSPGACVRVRWVETSRELHGDLPLTRRGGENGTNCIHIYVRPCAGPPSAEPWRDHGV